MFMLNQPVNTPIGQGRYQGHLTPNSNPELHVALVRLPINDETREHLKQTNCLTPRATQSGLWSFSESELK
jgi:hypothetical protein